VGVELKTAVGVQFDCFRKCEFTIKEFVGAMRMNGVVYFLRDGIQKPVNFLFFSRGFVWVVVSHLATNSFKAVHVSRHVGTMHVSKLLDELA
jgi:hypothetical protein